MKSAQLNKAFFITMSFFFLICGIFIVNKYFFAPSKHVSVGETYLIDNQIEELEAIKAQYDAKALSQINQAENLQKSNEHFEELKKHFRLAEQNRREALRLQKKIDSLKIQKIKIQKTKKHM